MNSSANSDNQLPHNIEGRSAEVGGISITRLLPTRNKRMVGAWCFLDHAGPVDFAADQGSYVFPHPHIGLQTFTWMIKGEILHRDSLGNSQVISPGQVNLMTAGKGIAHSEDSVHAGGSMHLAQLWIALPDAQRNSPPAFQNYPVLPVITQNGFELTVLVGEMLGKTSPVKVYSPLLGLNLKAQTQADLTLPLNSAFEHAVAALEGEVVVNGETVAPGFLYYLEPGQTDIRIQTHGAVQALLIGGKPFEEDIMMWWNFVARTQDEIEQAIQQWNAGDSNRFAPVQDNTDPPTPAPVLDGVHLKARR